LFHSRSPLFIFGLKAWRQNKNPEVAQNYLRDEILRGTTLIAAQCSHLVKLYQAFCLGNGACRNDLLLFRPFCSGTRLFYPFHATFTPSVALFDESVIKNNSFNAFKNM